VVGVSAAVLRVFALCGLRFFESVSPSSGISGQVRVGCGGALSEGRSLRTVRVVLEKCDRLVGLLGSVRKVSVTLEKYDKSNRVDGPNRKCVKCEKSVKFADPIQIHLAEVIINRVGH